MSLKFCANLSFMFQEETSLVKRYALASSCGFKAVECAFPYDSPLEELVEAQRSAAVKQVLVNTPVAKDGPGKFGLASVPKTEREFMTGLKLAVKYAKALDSSYVHIMSGTVKSPNESNYTTYRSNLKTAVELLDKENLTALIEPINKYSVPDYYMNCYHKAVEVIRDVDSDRLKLMLDIFHLQQIQGNLTVSVRELLPHVGHIQVAQVPDRHEPNTPGEIDYLYLFRLLEDSEYKGWIGLEYKPKTSTVHGLPWITQMGYKL